MYFYINVPLYIFSKSNPLSLYVYIYNFWGLFNNCFLKQFFKIIF